MIFTVVLTPVYLVLLAFSERAKKQKCGKIARGKELSILILSIVSIGVLTISLLHMPSFRMTSEYFILTPLIAGLWLCLLRSSPNLRGMRAFTISSVIMYHVILFYSPPPPSSIGIGERTFAIAKLTQEGSWNPIWGILHSTYNPFPMDVGLSCIISVITYIVLVSALALVKAFDGTLPRSNIVIANVSYVAAVFFYASAALGAFLLAGIITISWFMNKFSDGEWEKLFKNHLLRVALVAFLMIILARWVLTEGFMESILPSIKTFAMEMFGYYTPEHAIMPLYDQVVNPINAYAWSTPASMAIALALYCLIRRKALGGTLPFIMCIVGAAFLMLGFLFGPVARFTGFNSMWGTMYPGFVFLTPAAAVVGGKILRSSKALAATVLILMIVFVGVAINDPMLSREQYEKTGAGDIPPTVEDYFEARFLVDVVPTDKRLITSYEISSSFSYLEFIDGKVKHFYYTSSADTIRALIDRTIHDGEVLPRVIYVWPYRWFPDILSHLRDLPTNVFYDSGRYVIFECSE